MRASRRRGDLVVAVHSGLPDWGSGPKGKGKLYKISLRDRDAPAAGARLGLGPAGGPRRLRSPARPVGVFKDLARRASIEYGQAVSPGDRFESLRPGYEVVGRQMAHAAIRPADPLGPGLGRPPHAAARRPLRTRRPPRTR